MEVIMAKEGINRTISIPQPSIFGRIGTGIGRGLSESLPKEIERGRLQQGLQELGNQQGLSPFQQFSGLSSLPGVTPQMIQSGTELLKHQAQAQAFSKKNAERPPKFPRIQPNEMGQPRSNIPSLTKSDVFEKTQQGYIPPTIEDRDLIAANAFDENPAFFENNPQNSIQWANEKIAQEEKIANAYKEKHSNLTKIQDNVVMRLENQFKKLNGGFPRVPADLYSKIEDKAIQDTKLIEDGGKGLTEQESMKKYGDELLEADRQFAKLDEVGNWGIIFRPADESLRSLKAIQREMRNINQTDNMAKTLIAKNKFSPELAYAMSQPIYDVPKLNQFMKNIPPGNRTETLFETVYDIPGTLKIAPELAKFLSDENASPLAIAYELRKKGYDANTWLKYVVDHAKELNIKTKQTEQSETPLNTFVPLNDLWLKSFTGIE